MTQAQGAGSWREYRFDALRSPRWLIVVWVVSSAWTVLQGVLARRWVYAAAWTAFLTLAALLHLVRRRRPPLTRVSPEGLQVRLGFGALRHLPWSDIDEVRAPTRWETVTKVQLHDGRVVALPGVPPDVGVRLAEDLTARQQGRPGASVRDDERSGEDGARGGTRTRTPGGTGT